MVYKYRYIGNGEVHLPKFGIIAKSGETIESKEPIENPDFELLTPPDKPAVRPNKK